MPTAAAACEPLVARSPTGPTGPTRPIARLAQLGRRTWHGIALADIALAVGAATVTLAVLDAGGGGPPPAPVSPHDADALAVVLTLLAAAPLLLRRRYPALVLVLTLLPVAAFQGRGYPDALIENASLIAAYSVGAHSRDSRRVRIVAATVIGSLNVLNVAVALLSNRAHANPIGSVVGNVVLFGAAFLLGDNLRRRRERLDVIRERAEANERAQAMAARQLVADEQRRIARELHDVVAHSLSVMVVQAGAARRVVAARPDVAAEALAAIEQTGRVALDEMRQLLGVLRGEESPVPAIAPQPSVERLDELVASDPTLPVAVTITGVPRQLPALVDVQAYRIVQEGLTNVRKHAGPCTAHVTLAYERDRIDVAVTDDGRGAASGGPLPRDGHGIVGMRERAAIVGGTLAVGPRPGGGWAVRAALPAPDVRGAIGAVTAPASAVPRAVTSPAAGLDSSIAEIDASAETDAIAETDAVAETDALAETDAIAETDAVAEAGA